MVSCQEPSSLKGSKHSPQCHPHDARTFVCVHGGGGKVSPVQKHCTLPPHEEAILPSWSPSPWPSPLPSPSPSPTPTPSPCRCGCHHRHCRNRPLPSSLPWAIAVVAVNHCHRHLCCVAVSHCCRRRPCRRTLPSPSLSAIAVAIACRPSLSPCRRPFPRVVALARQELYSTNQSKECLPHFILLGQWAVY